MDEVFFPDLLYDFYDDDPAETAEQDNCPADTGSSPAEEALIRCVDSFGYIDMKSLTERTGKSTEELLADLGGTAVFQDPAVFSDTDAVYEPHRGWMLYTHYCDGNLVRKLEAARELDARPGFAGRFQNNISMLENILPEAGNPEDIYCALGANWIPEDIYRQFIRELFDLTADPDIRFIEKLAKWVAEIPGRMLGIDSKHLIDNVYGCPGMDALRILRHTMNFSPIEISDSIPTSTGTEKRVNRDKTAAAMRKQQLIEERFQTFLRSDPERKRLIEELYSKTFAQYGHGKYNGDFLSFPGLQLDHGLYPHQRDAVARILLSPNNVLLAHDVGTGKTLIFIAAVHELYRMGLSKKNLIVLPNSVLRQTVDEHCRRYPNDRILCVLPSMTKAERNRRHTADFCDFSKERIETLQKIIDEDYTAIYMADSSFNLLRLSKNYRLGKLRGQLQSVNAAEYNACTKTEKGVLRLEALRLNSAILKLQKETNDTVWQSFDQLGITTLVVDECQNYKNALENENVGDVIGLSRRADKSQNLLEICSYLMENEPEGQRNRIVFSTGTVISNSLADVFSWQSYLQPQLLSSLKLDRLHSWLTMFCENARETQFDITGTKLKETQRYSRFRNVNELMRLFSLVCDYHSAGESGRAHEGIPAYSGYENLQVSRSRAQALYIDELLDRIELIRTHSIDPKEDNYLKVTGDGRKAALDIRLVYPDKAVPAGIPCKISECARKCAELYRAYPGCSQLVLSDIGLPSLPGHERPFSVYEALRDELVSLKIPAERIAFIHDAGSKAEQQTLFERVQEGDISILIGSTEKIGVGVNVQKKLVALHHLSIPWRPSDIVQRNGRILRQGNTCPEVFIYRYVTEGTFDVYSWQLLETKQRFISDFLSGVPARSNEYTDREVLNYAEIKALAVNDDQMRDRVGTAMNLEKVTRLYRLRQNTLLKEREALARHEQLGQSARETGNPEEAERHEQRAAEIRRDLELGNPHEQQLRDLTERLDLLDRELLKK